LLCTCGFAPSCAYATYMARSIGSGVRLPRRGCEVNYAPCPLSRGLVLLLRVWPYLLLVPVWPVFGVQLQAGLGFLASRGCAATLLSAV